MKNKKIKLLMASSFISLGLVSCSTSKDTSDTLKIEGVKLGYGVKWMEDIVSAFTTKTGIKVNFQAVDGQAGVEALQAKIKAGGDGTDIFFSRITDFYKLAYQGNFVDVSDVWTSKDEDGKSIEDRTEQCFIDANKIGDKYVSFSWANGVIGIVRNNTIWNALGLKDDDIPYTTDEFITLCEKVRQKEFKYEGNQIYPLVYSYESEYYTSLLPIWFAQYEGSKNMEYFNEGIDPDDPEASKEHHTSSFYARDGIVESLQVAQDLLVNNDFHHPKSKNYQFESCQNDFLRNKTALFMANGSWLDTETNVKSYDASFINMPIVSSIIDNGRISSIKDDKTLSEVVKFIRGVNKEKPSSVSDEDVEIVKDAVQNGSYLRSGCDHQLVICSNSKKIDLAKQFVKYMYSNEGLSIFHKSMNGGVLGSKPSNGYSDSGIQISNFKKNVNEALKENNILAYNFQVPAKIFCYGGINRTFANGLGNVGDNCIKAMVSFNKSPSEVLNLNMDYLNKNWATILKQSGLN